MSKHTPGPLVVRMAEEWPFSILTFDSIEQCVFARDLPGRSSKDKCAADAISGKNQEGDWKRTAAISNARAIADEVLRAAAPCLLADLIDACEWLESMPPGDEPKASLARYRATISRATGEPK